MSKNDTDPEILCDTLPLNELSQQVPEEFSEQFYEAVETVVENTLLRFAMNVLVFVAVMLATFFIAMALTAE